MQRPEPDAVSSHKNFRQPKKSLGPLEPRSHRLVTIHIHTMTSSSRSAPVPSGIHSRLVPGHMMVLAGGHRRDCPFLALLPSSPSS